MKAMHGSHWGAFRPVVRDSRLVEAMPYEGDPHPSNLLPSVPDVLYHKSRVTTPAIRRGWLEGGPGPTDRRGGEEFVSVSWDEALDLLAHDLSRVRDRYGNSAIFGGSSGWASAGRFHHAKSQLQRFLALFGGFTSQVQNYSFGAAMTVLPHILGNAEAVTGMGPAWDDILSQTEILVAFGGIPKRTASIESGGSAQHKVEDRLRRLRQAGIKVVYVSPLRSDMPDYVGGEWLAARPNTDTAVLLGIAHTLLAESLHDETFLARCCTGFEPFASYLRGEADGIAKTAEWAAEISGLGPDAIRGLARRMAGGRTLITGTWSLQRAEFGEQPYWAIVAVAAMLGQIGLKGGGFGYGFGNSNSIGESRFPVAAPALPVPRNPIDSNIPVARISDLLLHPGERYEFNGRSRTYPEIRLIYWAGGNPFHHHQDINRLIRAWGRPDTIVVHEPWWTATARHADIVLPATTTLERNDIAMGGRDRSIVAMHKVVDPIGLARSDHDILADLADRFGLRAAFTEGRDEVEWLDHLFAEFRKRAEAAGAVVPDFKAFWEDGCYTLPEPTTPPVFAAFRDDPEAHPLKTPSGRIEITSATVAGFGYSDCPGHPAWMEPTEWLGGETAARFPLHLLSNQPATRLHSQLDGGRVSQESKIGGREPCLMCPQDAQARGLRPGDIVRIFNDRGECFAGLAVSEDVMPGVIVLSTGAWYTPEHPGRVGSRDLHGNPNLLTRDVGTSRLAQGPSAQSALVEVEAVRQAVPTPDPFTPPSIVETQRPGYPKRQCGT